MIETTFIQLYRLIESVRKEYGEDFNIIIGVDDKAVTIVERETRRTIYDADTLAEFVFDFYEAKV